MCILFSAKSTMYIVTCILCTIQCSLGTVHLTGWSLQLSDYSVQCEVNIIQCAVYYLQCAVYSPLYSLQCRGDILDCPCQQERGGHLIRPRKGIFRFFNWLVLAFITATIQYSMTTVNEFSFFNFSYQSQMFSCPQAKQNNKNTYLLTQTTYLFV